MKRPILRSVRTHASAFLLVLGATGLMGLSAQAHAQEKFTYMTNWYAQAEHGGFYQAVAQGLYAKRGLDVVIREEIIPVVSTRSERVMEHKLNLGVDFPNHGPDLAVEALESGEV